MNVQKMIAVVQIYIHHRKDVEVNIDIKSFEDITKLTIAYNIALNWLNNNGFKQF